MYRAGADVGCLACVQRFFISTDLEDLAFTLAHMQATFRAATPLLVMLWIPHHSFESIIDDGYPSDAGLF